jgi:GGDEF domain-containing protein
MLLKTLNYNERKFAYIKNASIVIFLLIFFATIYYRKMLKTIYRDIEFLLQIDKREGAYTIFSQEIDAISLRMNRKAVTQKNPDMIDSVTEINNYKGMLHSYAQKKGAKESNFTAVTVLEVDNFSKSNRAFAQDVIQAILKKMIFLF